MIVIFTLISHSAAQVPSWCNNIPSASWQYVSECQGNGGTAEALIPASGGVLPSWCEDIPVDSRHNVPSCTVELSGSRRCTDTASLFCSLGVLLFIVTVFFQEAHTEL